MLLDLATEVQIQGCKQFSSICYLHLFALWIELQQMKVTERRAEYWAGDIHRHTQEHCIWENDRQACTNSDRLKSLWAPHVFLSFMLSSLMIKAAARKAQPICCSYSPRTLLHHQPVLPTSHLQGAIFLFLWLLVPHDWLCGVTLGHTKNLSVA